MIEGFELGEIRLDGRILDSLRWDHFSIDFSVAFLTAVRQSAHWEPTTTSVRPLPGAAATAKGNGGHARTTPTMYRGHFKVKQLRDTYIDMSKWTKGVAVVNGFVLGRYWNIGPQQSLYVPSPILSHGTNELLVFELERTHNAKVKFVGKSSWTNHKLRTG